MTRTPARARSTLLALWIALSAATSARAQAYSRVGTDDLARTFNQGVQSINDRIDDLRRQARDPGLDMRQAARLVDQQSALRRQADTLWSATQSGVEGRAEKVADSIDRYNATNRNLEYRSALAGSAIDVLNNAASNPDRDDLDRKKAGLASDWDANYGSRLRPFGDEFAEEKQRLFKEIKNYYGVDLNETGYSRIGEINPYTNEVYYHYYGPDKQFVGGQWRDDADGWRRFRDDVDASRRRQQAGRDDLQQDSNDLIQFGNQLDQSRSSTGSALNSLRDEVRRIDFAGTWKGRDNVGNWLRLNLYDDGTLRYVWGKSSTLYDNNGRWSQSGQQIQTRTNDGEWRAQSRITQQFYLEFTEASSTGRRYSLYLERAN